MILLYFLLGIFFIQWFFPILESLSELATAAIELLKGKVGLKLAKYNAQIQKITEEMDAPIADHVIGFKVDPIDDEGEDEEEYDDE